MSGVREAAVAKRQHVEGAGGERSCWAEVWRTAWAAGRPGAIPSPGTDGSCPARLEDPGTAQETKGQTPGHPRQKLAATRLPQLGDAGSGAALCPRKWICCGVVHAKLHAPCVTLAWQQPLHQCSRELTSYTGVKNQDTRDGQTAKTAAEAQP